MNVTREGCRTIGALVGLVVMLGGMWLLGYGGIIPLAVAGAGGAVLGGISGEQYFDRRRLG